MRTLIIVFAILFISCSSNPEHIKATLAVKNVDIIKVRDGSIANDQWVLIDSGNIIKITNQELSLSPETKIIDGDGKYLLPGLAEMHAHIPSEIWGGDIMNTLFLYLSNGVTTIRGMQGHPIHLKLRENAKANKILSPRIFTSSPGLTGSTVKTPEEADQKIRQYKEDGYDFLKLLPGIKREVFDQIVATANELGIEYAGHVSTGVGIRHALQSNYASVDHLDGYLDGLVPESANVNPHENGFFGFNFTYLADTAKIDELVKMSKEHGVWVVPTQTLFERWYAPGDPEEMANQPEMKYMPDDILQGWIDSKKRMVDEDFNVDQWEKFNEIRRKLLLKLHLNGQGLLLGSDAPQVFNVPGFSIHHELASMIKVGLTPLEAIQIGTINPAIYFDMEGEFGEVIENASADLLLVDENPLENIGALKKLSGVIVRGRWLSKDDITEKLNEIATK